MVSSRNQSWLVAALAVAVVAVSACSGSDSDDTAAPAPSASTASPSPSASGGLPTCATDDLSVDLERASGGGTAGATHSTLTFTNTSDAACAMTGWPGVSYVGDGDGTQIGAAADRTGSPSVLTLRPDAAATADLTEDSPGAHGCSTHSDGFRVYPPNNKAAVFVQRDGQACADDDEHLLTIGPVRAASGS